MAASTSADDPVLGLLRLRIEPRPRWSERRQHRVVLRDGEPAVEPWRQPLPGLHAAQEANTVSPSGRTLVLPVREDPDPFSREPWRLVMCDVAGTWTRELGHPLSTRPGVVTVRCAVSPDDTLVAVAYSDGPPPTVQVLRAHDLHVVAERALPGLMSVDHNSVGMQWSPDGTALFVTVREPGRVDRSLAVLDASLQTVTVVSGTIPLGSLSWAPSGDAIAVEHDRRAHVLHLEGEHLEPVRWLPEEIWDPPSAPVVLGLLSGGRALVMRQTRRRARVLEVDLETGGSQELASLRVTDRDWPVHLVVTRRWEEVASSTHLRTAPAIAVDGELSEDDVE